MKLLSAKTIFLFYCSSFLIACQYSESVIYPEGGYPYLKSTLPQDSSFYYFPLRNHVDLRDSISIAEGKFWYSAFNEPNLSLAPPKEDLFRFVYFSWPGDLAVISLSENKVIIKEEITDTAVQVKSGMQKVASTIKVPDKTILDSIERLHYELFDKQYHLSDPKFPSWRKRYFDSLKKVYPKLFDPSYYIQLKEKVFSKLQPFEYTIKEVEISESQFRNIIRLINTSGFWKKSFYNEDCSVMDGESIYIEAITKQKYKGISFRLCPEDSLDLRKAYSLVLNYAGIEDGKLGRQDKVSRAVTIEKVETGPMKLTEPKQKAK